MILAFNYKTLNFMQVKAGIYSLLKELYLANPKSAIFRTALSSFEDIRRFCLGNRKHQIENKAPKNGRLEIKSTWCHRSILTNQQGSIFYI